MSELKNLFFATVLSVIILTGWQFFYESKHHHKDIPPSNISTEVKVKDSEKIEKNPISESEKNEVKAIDNNVKQINKKDLLITIDNDIIDGTFSKQGLIFDTISLKKYRENLEVNSPEVTLLDKKNFYYAELAFTPSEDSNIELPNKNTIWEADGNAIKQNQPLNLSWTNKDGMKFLVTIELDNNYLFKIERKVINNKNEELNINFVSRIFKSINKNSKGGVGHEGLIGFFDKEILKIPYGKLEKKDGFSIKSHNPNDKLSWIGFGDKYWMSAIISNEKNSSVSVHNVDKEGEKIFEIEDKYSKSIDASGEFTRTEYMFFGAKELTLLDRYALEKDILMFDHAVDFGTLYFITKPIFLFLQLLYKVIGNFGIAIMILTLVIKLLLFPLTKKSLMSMNKMKKLQPQIDEIKIRHKDNKAAMNLEIVALFKANKINPFSSIMPMLLQIPIFFALYKVLYITIEMRHTPFFGWIKDLSSRDTLNIFSIFDFLHLGISNYVHLGVLSLILGLTMLIQQKTQPKVSDPNQMVVMKWMPWIFTIASSSFPAGLVIYWSWNNIISTIQQVIVERLVLKKESKIIVEKVK